jgi:hypothetical protein
MAKEEQGYVHFEGDSGIGPEDPKWVPWYEGGPECHSIAEEWPGFHCTLKEGHPGPHAAHGGPTELYATWPQEEKP